MNLTQDAAMQLDLSVVVLLRVWVQMPITGFWGGTFCPNETMRSAESRNIDAFIIYKQCQQCNSFILFILMAEGYQNVYGFFETKCEPRASVGLSQPIQYHQGQFKSNNINPNNNMRTSWQAKNNTNSIQSLCGGCLMHLKGEEVVDFGFTKTKRRISLSKDRTKIQKKKQETPKKSQTKFQNKDNKKILNSFLSSLHQTTATKV